MDADKSIANIYISVKEEDDANGLEATGCCGAWPTPTCQAAEYVVFSPLPFDFGLEISSIKRVVTRNKLAFYREL